MRGIWPYIGQLMREGSSASLQSAAAEFPDEVWPSIYTSRNSAQLGKYYYIQPKAGSSELELIDDTPRMAGSFGKSPRARGHDVPSWTLRKPRSGRPSTGCNWPIGERTPLAAKRLLILLTWSIA